MSESLLPPNATETERHIEAVLARIEDIPVPIRTLWNPQTCPEPFLPWLAWTFSVDVWSQSWSVAVKRRVIAEAVKTHRHKGTIGAMRAAVEALDLGIDLSEWFDYGGDPYWFRLALEITSRGLSEAEYRAIVGTVEETKNVRSWYDLLVYMTTRGARRLGVVQFSGEITEVRPFWIESRQVIGLRIMAVGWQEHLSTTIYPV